MTKDLLQRNMRKPPSLNPMGERFMLTLASNPRNVAQVEQFVEKFVSRFNVCQNTYGNILISLTEAVNNAIIHGNRNDESKTVQVMVRKRNGDIAFRVSDEGTGFDYNSLPDPTAPDNLTKLGGRGVFLMKELSDDMRYYDNGRTVEMRFNI